MDLDTIRKTLKTVRVPRQCSHHEILTALTQMVDFLDDLQHTMMSQEVMPHKTSTELINELKGAKK